MKTYLISLLILAAAQSSVALELENILEPTPNKLGISGRAAGGEWRGQELSLSNSTKFKVGEGDSFGLHPRLTYQSVDMETLNRTPGFLTAKMAASYGTTFSSKEVLHAQVGASATQEVDRTSQTQWTPDMIGIATYHFSDNFILLYGAGLTYLLDQDHFFPILGAQWKISDKLRLLTILPLLINLSYEIDEAFTVVGFIKPNGFKSKFKNDGALPGQSDDLDIRSGSVTLGTGLRYRVQKNFVLKSNLGIQTNRRVSLYSGSDKLAEYDPKRDGFLALELELRY